MRMKNGFQLHISYACVCRLKIP